MTERTVYADRLQRVVDFVAAHLDDVLTLDALAHVASFSPYHFHRIYRGTLGETVNDTVRRLRLQRAALDLLDRELSIERTARRAGYGSQAAFTRAFRAEYGEPPARYRVAQQERRRQRIPESPPYDVQLVTLPAVRVAAIAHRGDYQLAPRAFERLIAHAATTGLLTPATRTFGMFTDDPESVPPSELRSAACITVPPDWTPSGDVIELHIDGGRYARIVHTGPYIELRVAYDWLYQTWLPTSGEEPRDHPCVEEYLNDPRQVPAKDLHTAVMLPLDVVSGVSRTPLP